MGIQIADSEISIEKLKLIKDTEFNGTTISASSNTIHIHQHYYFKRRLIEGQNHLCNVDEPFFLHVSLYFQVLLKITSLKEKSFIYLF